MYAIYMPYICHNFIQRSPKLYMCFLYIRTKVGRISGEVDLSTPESLCSGPEVDIQSLKLLEFISAT